MKYKVGDRVKVKCNLDVGRLYGIYTFVSDMGTQLGRVVTIKAIDSDGYRIIEDGGDFFWSDEMFVGLAEGGCIYAYELMKLAAENPEAYKGKKYKVVKGNCIDCNGNKPMAVLVSLNGVLTDEFDYAIYVTSETILEEIKPEPKPVPFLEAVKALDSGKDIYSENGNGIRHYYTGVCFRDEKGFSVMTEEILRRQWYIKED